MGENRLTEDSLGDRSSAGAFVKPGTSFAGHETLARQSVRFINWSIPQAAGFGRQTWRMGMPLVGLGT